MSSARVISENSKLHCILLGWGDFVMLLLLGRIGCTVFILPQFTCTNALNYNRYYSDEILCMISNFIVPFVLDHFRLHTYVDDCFIRYLSSR